MSRIIQSELDDDDFELFSKICLEKNISPRYAIRIAIKNWLHEPLPLPSDDLLFALKAKDAPTTTPARRIDDVLYGKREDSDE
ncbi:MAG: hypothetical protein ACFFB3_21955 [Candidatus Hodarchaeota archaeon]